MIVRAYVGVNLSPLTSLGEAVIVVMAILVILLSFVVFPSIDERSERVINKLVILLLFMFFYFEIHALLLAQFISIICNRSRNQVH